MAVALRFHQIEIELSQSSKSWKMKISKFTLKAIPVE